MQYNIIVNTGQRMFPLTSYTVSQATLDELQRRSLNLYLQSGNNSGFAAARVAEVLARLTEQATGPDGAQDSASLAIIAEVAGLLSMLCTHSGAILEFVNPQPVDPNEG